MPAIKLYDSRDTPGAHLPDETGRDAYICGCPYLFGEDLDVLVEGLRRADIAACDARLARRACRQFALLEDEREKREKRVPVSET